jgi:hypothetical protein
VGACGRDRTSVAIVARVGRRRSQGLLPELRCDDRSAARDRDTGCCLELRGDLGVRLFRCKRAMAGACEGVVDDLGKSSVRAPASFWRGGLVEH